MGPIRGCAMGSLRWLTCLCVFLAYSCPGSVSCSHSSVISSKFSTFRGTTGCVQIPNVPSHIRLRGGTYNSESTDEDSDFDLIKRRLSEGMPEPDWKDMEKERKKRMKKLPVDQETEEEEEEEEEFVELPGDEHQTEDDRAEMLREVQEKFPYMPIEKLSAVYDHPNFQTFKKGLSSEASKLIEEYMPEAGKERPRRAKKLSPLKDASKGPQHALWLACQKGATDEVIFDLAAKANVNATDSEWHNFTALHYAAERGQVPVVEVRRLIARRGQTNAHVLDVVTKADVLIALEACANARDGRGFTPELIAMAKGQQGVLDVFNNGREILMLAENNEPEEDLPPPKDTLLEELLMSNLPKDEKVRAMMEA